MRTAQTPRGLLEQVERLSARRFVELVGLIAGVLVGTPQILAGSAEPLQPALFRSFTVLLLAAGVLLWWIAVRRRQFSVWRTAWHVTLALALGDLLGFTVAFVAASIQTNGEYADAYVHAPWSTTLPGLLIPTLLYTPGRLVGTAAFVALGRIRPRRARRAPTEA